MSSRIDELDAIVRRFDLNDHPFYTEWRAGTLPVERLAEYADEWAPFIGAVDAGWERIGYPDYAASTWNLRRFMWAPALGLRGILRLTPFKDVFIASGSAVVYSTHHLHEAERALLGGGDGGGISFSKRSQHLESQLLQAPVTLGRFTTTLRMHLGCCQPHCLPQRLLAHTCFPRRQRPAFPTAFPAGRAVIS